MTEFVYSISIGAPPQVVWGVLTELEPFRIWAKSFSPQSSFEGEWKKGGEIAFIDEGKGGTVARIDQYSPYQIISATHIATLTQDRVRETQGEFTEKWMGTKETYILEEQNGETHLKITMLCQPEFKKMFEESWPQALAEIKRISEDSV